MAWSSSAHRRLPAERFVHFEAPFRVLARCESPPKLDPRVVEHEDSLSLCRVEAFAEFGIDLRPHTYPDE